MHGDIIKLGRVKFKVKDYRIEDASQEEEKKAHPDEEVGPIDQLIFEDQPK